MLRTQCAQCAAPLAHNAPRCGICKTRYCGRECQKLHWKGGHKELCPVIKRRGGPELIYAEKKYKEAVAVAVEKCADDTKGQTCYICTQALHWKTREGLVRGCACRGTAGFAHVSCLAEQAKILWAEAEENNLDGEREQSRWDRWDRCSLCKQPYHGVVKCAFGWACWKTYVGRPEMDVPRRLAMSVLGNGLHAAGHNEDALSVRKADLAMMRRIGGHPEPMLVGQANLADTYNLLGRYEDAVRIERDVYSGRLKLHGEEHKGTLTAASNYATSLIFVKRFEEAKSLLRKTIPVARRVLGESNDVTLRLRWTYATALYGDTDATLDDICEAEATLADTERIAERVLGSEHPLTAAIERDLINARGAIADREMGYA